jgi:hypothetical protein
MKTNFYNVTNPSSNNLFKNKAKIMVFGEIFLISFIAFTLIYSIHSIFAQMETENKPNNNNAIIKDPDKQVPSVAVFFDEKEIEMDPFLYSKKNQSNTLNTTQVNSAQSKIITKIGNANLFETQSDSDPKIILKQGDKITLSYGKQPLEIKGYLIDYDSENEAQIYPIKQIDYSTFNIPIDAPVGLTNLEVRCFFENNEQITYTTPVFVETSSPEINSAGLNEQNEDDKSNEEETKDDE